MVRKNVVPYPAVMPSTTFFSYGFRPFFLLAGIHAAVTMAVWIAWLALSTAGFELGPNAAWPGGQDPLYLWHAHEMLFGFIPAVIAGFFLTAVPSWTGSRPLQGGPLVLLAGIWLAGRMVAWYPALFPPVFIAVADLAFIPMLTVFLAKPLLVKRSPRSLIFLPLLTAYFAANLLTYFDDAATGNGLALNVTLLLIAIVGGRVVPSFTANALRQTNATDLPRSTPSLEGAAILLILMVLIADLVDPDALVTGGLAAAAALANGLRLAGWRGSKTLDQPILWILHLSYAWIAIGLACKAVALLTGFLPTVTAQHALMIGAAGSMTLAMMTRASLGHTGRPLVVAPAITLAYILISLAALIRVAGPAWLAQFDTVSLMISGIAWIAAFTIYSAVYWPILTGARLN